MNLQVGPKFTGWGLKFTGWPPHLVGAPLFEMKTNQIRKMIADKR